MEAVSNNLADIRPSLLDIGVYSSPNSGIPKLPVAVSVYNEYDNIVLLLESISAVLIDNQLSKAQTNPLTPLYNR